MTNLAVAATICDSGRDRTQLTFKRFRFANVDNYRSRAYA